MRRISISSQTSHSRAAPRVVYLVFLDLRITLAGLTNGLVYRSPEPPAKRLNSFIISLSNNIFYALAHLTIIVTSLLASLSLAWEGFSVIRVDLSRVVVFREHAHSS